MAFMATASVVCASSEMEPYDMAPVQNRFTISFAGSTCADKPCQSHGDHLQSDSHIVSGQNF